MNWIRRQLNEIIALFFLSFGVTPTEEMKEQLGIAKPEPQPETSDNTPSTQKDEQS